jgi:hypothetical protein
MKVFVVLAALAAFVGSAVAGEVKYPAGSPASAIAVDKAVKAEIAGKPGVEFCQTIDTRTGKCLVLLVLDAGGGGDGGGGGQ